LADNAVINQFLDIFPKNAHVSNQDVKLRRVVDGRRKSGGREVLPTFRAVLSERGAPHLPLVASAQRRCAVLLGQTQ